MEIKRLEYDFTVCKIKNEKDLDLTKSLYFIGKTEEELSLVCLTQDVPKDTLVREDGWKAFKIQGILDFSLIGILSKITNILAENKIGVFVVSTYNTDYVLVKKENFDEAIEALKTENYTII